VITTSDQLLTAIKALERREQHAINTYEPSHTPGHDQLAFHKSTARYRLLFGGNQSGKSHGAAYEIACWATGKHPYRKIPDGDIEIWVISAEYITLQKGIYRHLSNLIPTWDIKKKGPNVPNNSLPSYLQIKRKDGSTALITFMSSKGDSHNKFQAAQVDLISIDEEVPQNIWEELQARTLAAKSGSFIISATLVESFDWVLKLESRGEDKKDSEVFLTRLNTELNPYVNQETLRELKATWSLETQEYRLYGKSRRSTGLIYNTFSEEHVIPRFPIPHDWPKWCGIDPGIRTTAVLWIAVDPNNNAYAYREMYAHNEALFEIARAIKIAEGWHLNKHLSKVFGHYVWEDTAAEQPYATNTSKPEIITQRLIDPSSQRRTEAGDDPIFTRMHQQYGLLCTPANNAKREGIECVRFWLDNGFKVFDHLDNFLDERRSYRIRSIHQKKDRNDPIDEPVKSKDHLMDCWRYVAIEKPRWEDKIHLTNNDSQTLDPYSRRAQGTGNWLQYTKQRGHLDEYFGTEW